MSGSCPPTTTGDQWAASCPAQPITLDGDLVVDPQLTFTPACMNGETIQLCWSKSPTGASTIAGWVAQGGNIVTAGNPPAVFTHGACPEPVTVDAKIPSWVAACDDWCNETLVCVEADGTISDYMVAGVAQGAPPPATVRLGACQIVDQTTKSVWVLDAMGCPQPQGLVQVFQLGPKQVVWENDAWVPVADHVPVGAMVLAEDAKFCTCEVSPVAAASSYLAGTISGLTVWSCTELDCDTGDWADPAVVTIGTETVTVTPDMPWTWPPQTGGCCEGDISQDITITGDFEVRAWLYESKEVCQ